MTIISDRPSVHSPSLFFEDLPPGWTRTLGPLQVSREDIVAFARDFDAQPFHLDEAAAKATFVGGLIASGWHICSLNMRLVADGFLLDTASMGAPGVEEVKWAQPLRPGETIRAHARVLESRVSASRPDLGLVRFVFEVVNQDDRTIMTQTNWILIGRRGTSPSAGKGPPKDGPNPTRAASDALPATAASAALYLDDLVPGETQDLGSHRFTDEDIIRFARQFDPQRFHVDPVAAKESLFGGLCASGWHTASLWMKLQAEHRDRATAEALARGLTPARVGPSPGFKNMRWLKPVYAGDTIRYASTLLGTRPSASRPGWGLATHRNSGINQHGEEVFGFEGTVFWERRPD